MDGLETKIGFVLNSGFRSRVRQLLRARTTDPPSEGSDRLVGSPRASGRRSAEGRGRDRWSAGPVNLTYGLILEAIAARRLRPGEAFLTANCP